MRRRGLLVLGAALAGAAAAAVVTFLQEPTYRADASVALVRRGQPPGNDPSLAAAARAAAQLFESRAVTDSVVANLRLGDSPDELLERVDVAADAETSLVRVAADAPSRDEARQLAQAVTEVATVLYNDRFGPETTASVWEVPRVQDEAIAPDTPLYLGLGTLLGGLAGGALAFGAGRRRREPAERRPEPAAPGPAPRAPQPRRLTLPELERLAEALPPARREAAAFYVEAAREVAAPDGSVSRPVELLLRDVLGDVSDAGRAPSPAS